MKNDGIGYGAPSCFLPSARTSVLRLARRLIFLCIS